MGNNNDSNIPMLNENMYRKNNFQNNSNIDEKNNLFINEGQYTFKNNFKQKINYDEKTEENELNSTLLKQIQEIASDIKEIKENKERNNHYFNQFPIIGSDYILERMKNEWIEKEKKNFKNQIKSEIKGNLISPEIKILKAEIEKLNKAISNIEIEREKEKECNNIKISDLIKKNSNEIEKMNKNFTIIIDNLKNNFELKISNLFNQLNNYKSNLEKYKNENQKEIENLKQEIKQEKEEKEVLKRHIEIINKKQIILEKQNEEKENKLNTMNKEIEEINKTFKQKTIKLIKLSFANFGEKLKKNFLLNKNKKQKEIKNKLFFGNNYAKVGLINNGNNCYINSVLQILKNIPKFTYSLSSLKNIEDKFLSSLKELLINLCKSDSSSISLKEFKTYLGFENKQFEGNNQYDSTIFYISLLNIINKKLNNKNKSKIKRLDMNQYKNKTYEEQFKIWKEHYLLKNTTFSYDLFYIFFSNEIMCKNCNDSKIIFQSTNYLDFPIVTEKGVVETLEECFLNYQEEKELEDECSQCHSNKISQRFTLYELPPVLVINLKRVGEKSAYFNDIKIPFQLDMNKLIKKIKNNSIYELRGLIKHSGDENSGHNFAFCKNMFDDLWYEYNDSVCTAIEGEPELDKIFFLCYIKVGSDIENIEYLKKIISI